MDLQQIISGCLGRTKSMLWDRLFQDDEVSISLRRSGHVYFYGIFAGTNNLLQGWCTYFCLSFYHYKKVANNPTNLKIVICIHVCIALVFVFAVYAVLTYFCYTIQIFLLVIKISLYIYRDWRTSWVPDSFQQQNYYWMAQKHIW